MNVCVVTPFYYPDSDISRPAFVREVLLEAGHDVLLISSDFSHAAKNKVDFEVENSKFVRTLKYTSNKSIVRFISHVILSWRLFFNSFINRKKVDVYYVTAPFAITALLIKIFTGKKVVVDIVDFWPSSLPFGNHRILKGVLSLWTVINGFVYKKVDYVFSLSTSFLNSANISPENQINLGVKKAKGTKLRLKPDDDKLVILYIGNLGTLYDFDTLLKAIVNVNLDIAIRIVGDGDRRIWFCEQLELNNIEYEYFGMVYDEEQLLTIIDNCDVGFNGYRDTTASFSYKATTYLKHSLPIINSMKGDLEQFVNDYDIGENYIDGDYNSLCDAIKRISSVDTKYYESNVNKFFLERIDYSLVSNQILEVFERLYDKKNI